MATIIASPGTSGQFPTLTIKVSGDTLGLAIPMLQDITINNSNDVFTWTQLNSGSKFQIATTSTNSVSGNMVVDEDVFFGKTASGETAQTKGVFGLSKEKTKVSFTIKDIGTKDISGEGYLSGLAPTVSADSPVWVTPLTINVLGDYTVA